MSSDSDFDGVPPSPPYDARLVEGEFSRLGHPYCHMMVRDDPFMIDVSDEEDVQDAPQPVYGDVIEGETKDNFGLNLPSPRHSDIERLYELLGRSESTMTDNSDIPPVGVDTAEPEDIYSSFYSSQQLPETVFASENTLLSFYVEDPTEVGPEYSTQVSDYRELGFADSPLGVAEVENEVIPPMIVDDAVFDPDMYYTDFAGTTFDSQDSMLADQVRSRAAQVMADDDVAMTDVSPMVPPYTIRDDSLPPWMTSLLHPSFLQELKVGCNLDGIDVEKDKIHFSFA
ncbi:hypothetical protein F4679DRAFT_585920 [Xylaria curta]|nr:hypothetical protein F4679DRAFT_585920 [Xylaria curta]